MLKDVTITAALELAILTEEQAADLYAKLAHRFADKPDLRDLFDQLARDEQTHRRQFAQLLETVPEQEARQPADDLDYLKAMSASEFFSPQGPLAGLEQSADRTQALLRVFAFEKATLGFYRAIADVLGESRPLALIIRAEKAHIVKVMKYLLVLGSQFRGLGDPWP